MLNSHTCCNRTKPRTRWCNSYCFAFIVLVIEIILLEPIKLSNYNHCSENTSESCLAPISETLIVVQQAKSMRIAKQKRPIKSKVKEVKESKMSVHSNIICVLFFLLCASAFYLVWTFQPLNKEEQIKKFSQMSEDVEPFRKNVTACARQTKSSMADVENFFKRIPQSTMQGKCFVACILKKNNIIVNNKISAENLLNANRAFYSDDTEVMSRLKTAIYECNNVVKDIFEICQYASLFNDCMHMRMEHILDKITMERRMEALGQMSKDPDVWSEEEDELLKLAKDEL